MSDELEPLSQLTGLPAGAMERLAAELGPHLVPVMVKVAQATFDNALRRLALPLEEPATVQTSTTDLTAGVSVILDSQYTGTAQPPSAVTVQNLTGIPLTAGQRVMVWHAPNGGAYAKHLISGPGALFQADVQVFSTTGAGTWTKPIAAQAGTLKNALITVIGAAGGGGSGRRGAAASIRSGGGGGGGGAYTFASLPLAALGATETLTVGVGGAGGLQVAPADTNGNVGTVGANSVFGTASLVVAGGGGGGVGGTATGAAGGVAGLAGTSAGGAGGASSATGGIGVAAATTEQGAPGGGAGGGVTAANAGSAGGAGGAVISPLRSGGAAGAAGAAGTTGVDAGAGEPTAGSGGGGGGGTASGGAGGTGAAGGDWGAGGGGGGGSLNGVGGGQSGAGGLGANGIVVVVAH